MIVRLAEISDTREVLSFFECQLRGCLTVKEMPEFGCEMGVRAAIRQGQVLIAIEDGRIIAALRFYRRKRDWGVSLYQFAITPEFRGNRLTNELLSTLEAPITAQCSKMDTLNGFYRETGWVLSATDERFNYWLFPRVSECP